MWDGRAATKVRGWLSGMDSQSGSELDAQLGSCFRRGRRLLKESGQFSAGVGIFRPSFDVRPAKSRYLKVAFSGWNSGDPETGL